MSEIPETAIDQTDIPVQDDTWERDENATTLMLRSLAALLAGGMLLWAQFRAPVPPFTGWASRVEIGVIANLVLPLGIVWMFFGQGLSHLDWISDQKYNAWSYGWNLKPWRRHLLLSLAMFAVMLGPTLWFARQPTTKAYYIGYFPEVAGALPWLWLIASLVLYMLCWEWFFRGFLLFGMAQGFSFVVAIVIQALLFGLAHGGKPGPEFWSSFAGGLVLGGICWHEKSFVPGFLTHALIQIAFVISLKL
jgi:membrane protease YdiL (CAAX protease family)